MQRRAQRAPPPGADDEHRRFGVLGNPDQAADRLSDVDPYAGRVLWVGGDRSDYVREEYAGAMDRWFPRNQRVTIKGAGHWVHSERPETFVAVLRRFLGDSRGD